MSEIVRRRRALIALRSSGRVDRDGVVAELVRPRLRQALAARAGARHGVVAGDRLSQAAEDLVERLAADLPLAARPRA